MSCSFPLFRQWLNANFGDLCHHHDQMWVQRVWKLKVASDFDFCSLMAARGYTAIAYGALLWFTIPGTIYWLWKKYKRRV